MRSARAGNLVDVGKNRRPLTEVGLELARVKKELVKFRKERDILKSCCVLCQGVAARHVIIDETRPTTHYRCFVRRFQSIGVDILLDDHGIHRLGDRKMFD